MSMPRSALVLGASGDQGFPQAVELARQGWQVRAGARDTPRLRAALAAALPADLAARVDVVAIDYADTASLRAACAGIDVLLANYPSSSFHDGAALVAAAEATATAAAGGGVGLAVLNTSLPLPAASLGFPAQDVRIAQRAALRARLPTISIQPVVFMDNLLRGWAYPAITRGNRFEYPHAADLEVSWLCLRDLARLMAAAASRPALAGQDIAVGGPQVLQGADVARHLSAASGREIAFVSQPVEDFCARMRTVFRQRATLDAEALVVALGRVYHWYNASPLHPFRVDAAAMLAQLPVPLTPFADWAAAQCWDSATD